MLPRPRNLPAGFVQPCLPMKAPKPPSGALWLHEIKHDGFRIIARKDGQRVKLYSRPGNDLTDRSRRDKDYFGIAGVAPASELSQPTDISPVRSAGLLPATPERAISSYAYMTSQAWRLPEPHIQTAS